MEQLVFQVQEFQGPLDLLLQLITTHKMDIYDIPIRDILAQYLAQIQRMQEQNLAVSSDFLEMAARLIYIKSAQMLPKDDTAEEMRQQITRELLEYRAVQSAAAWLSRYNSGAAVSVREMEQLTFDMTYRRLHHPAELLSAYQMVENRLVRQEAGKKTILRFSDTISHKPVSVASRVVFLIRRLSREGELRYSQLFEGTQDNSQRVATFLALLELLKARRLMLRQSGEESYIKLERAVNPQ